MIKVKVTKNIIRNGTIMFGLTLKQVIATAIAIGIGLILVFLLRSKMSMNALMGIVFTEIAVVMAFGVVQIQGMSFVQIILLMFKGVDKRPYCVKGVFDNEEKE